jgi:hypothetical protein
MMSQLLPEDPRFRARPIFKNQPDVAIFHACAEVPAVWRKGIIGITPGGPPFDVQEFLRLCEEAKQ